MWMRKAERAVALIGIRLTYRDKDNLIGELLWATAAATNPGNICCRIWNKCCVMPAVWNVGRSVVPAGSRMLKQHGYKITHYQMEKVL